MTRKTEKWIVRALFLGAMLCAALFWLAGGLAQAQSTKGPNGDTLTDVGAGTVKEVCVTPTVTPSNSYGTNYDIGGVLTFQNAFPPSGGGVLQSVYVNTGPIETMGWTFTPLVAPPSSASTFNDGAVAAISTLADKNLARGAVTVNGTSFLGTHTAGQATQLGQAISVGRSVPTLLGVPLYGVLTANAALTNQFATNADLTICVDIAQFQ